MPRKRLEGRTEEWTGLILQNPFSHHQLKRLKQKLRLGQSRLRP